MTAEDDQAEPAIGRVEAFSDGVLAIIITIMVLELRPPERPGIDQLLRLWPLFSAYLLSFAYVGIYWVNHHRLVAHARRVTNALVWLNLLLLFTLSLVPFSTAYMGQQHFSGPSVRLYLLTMLLPAIGYVPLERVIRASGVRTDAAERYHRQATRKGLTAVILYLLGIPLTVVSPWLGVGAAAVVAMLWFLPASPIDGWFDG